MLYYRIMVASLLLAGCGNQVSVPKDALQDQVPPVLEQVPGQLTIGVQPAFPLVIDKQRYENIEEFATNLIQQLPDRLASVGIDPIVAKRAKLLTDLSIYSAFDGSFVSLLADEMPYTGTLGEDGTIQFNVQTATYSVRLIKRLEIDVGTQPVCANLVGRSENSPIVKDFQIQITAVSCSQKEGPLSQLPPATLYKGMSMQQAVNAVPSDYLSNVSTKGQSGATFCFGYQSVLDKNRMCSDYSSGPYTGATGLQKGCYCTLEFDKDGKLTQVKNILIRYLDTSLIN